MLKSVIMSEATDARFEDIFPWAELCEVPRPLFAGACGRVGRFVAGVLAYIREADAIIEAERAARPPDIWPRFGIEDYDLYPKQ